MWNSRLRVLTSTFPPFLSLPCFPSWRGWHGSSGSTQWASSEVERPRRWGGDGQRSTLPSWFPWQATLKKRPLHSSSSYSFPASLPPSGALTKETWLSQRPAADLLIHSLCPFYVLLQTYLQRGRRKGEEGGEHLSQHELYCYFCCVLMLVKWVFFSHSFVRPKKHPHKSSFFLQMMRQDSEFLEKSKTFQAGRS